MATFIGNARRILDAPEATRAEFNQRIPNAGRASLRRRDGGNHGRHDARLDRSEIGPGAKPPFPE